MSPTIEYRMDHPQSLLCKRISFVSIISLNSINSKPKIDFSHLFRIWSITPLGRVFKLLASSQFWTEPIRMLRLKTRLKISNTFLKNTFQSKLFPSLKSQSYGCSYWAKTPTSLRYLSGYFRTVPFQVSP